MNKRVLSSCTVIFGIALLFMSVPAFAQGTMFVEGDKVGIHTSSPAQEFHLVDGPDANPNGAFRIETSSHAWDFATINNTGTFRISKLGTGVSEFDISAGGNLVITGTLTTGGTTCGDGGCDRVFEADAEREDLEKHADAMWESGFLPAVGPTPENTPLNLTEKVGGILHELEMAHIYIEQLHEEKKALVDRLARLEKVVDRLASTNSSFDDSSK